MRALKDSTKINLNPTMELKPQSPQRVISPRKITREDSALLSKPPGRISPFKGRRSQLTDKEIFGITPKRLQTHTNTQSVDRNGFNFTALVKPDPITFSSMTGMAASKSMNTPSRIIRGRKPSSEQPTRLNRPTISSTLRQEPSVNLMSKFQAKSILKRRQSPPSESDESLDMATTLNTMKNTGHAKDVISFLSEDPELIQPRKRRAVTFDNTDQKDQISKVSSVCNGDIMAVLQQLLANQEKILKRLNKLEGK